MAGNKEKPIEEAATMKQCEELVQQQFQMNFSPSEKGMHFIVTTGAFKQEIITIPPDAMTAASKMWALFVKDRADAQRALQQVKQHPRGPRLLHDT